MIELTQGHRSLKLPTERRSTLLRGLRVVLKPVKAVFSKKWWKKKICAWKFLVLLSMTSMTFSFATEDCRGLNTVFLLLWLFHLLPLRQSFFWEVLIFQEWSTELAVFLCTDWNSTKSQLRQNRDIQDSNFKRGNGICFSYDNWSDIELKNADPEPDVE